MNKRRFRSPLKRPKVKYFLMICAGLLTALATLRIVAAANTGQEPGEGDDLRLEATAHLYPDPEHDLFFNLAALTDVAWSPDGTKIAAYAAAATKIYIWSATDGRIKSKVTRHEAITSGAPLAFLPDEKTLLVSAGPQRPSGPALSTINIETGTFGNDIPGPFPLGTWRDNLAANFVFSPATRSLVASFAHASSSPFVVYGLTPKGELSVNGFHETSFFPTMAITADGRHLAVTLSEGVATIIDTMTWKQEKEIDFFPEEQSISGRLRNFIVRLAFSPEGNYLAAGAFGIEIRRPRPKGLPSGVPEPNFDSQPMMSNETRHPVRIYNLDRNRFVDIASGLKQPIQQLAWLSQDVLLVTDDKSNLDVCQQSRNGPWQIHELLPPNVLSFSLSANRHMLAVSSHNEITVYNIGNQH